jgi:hypothetical protein
MMCEELIKARQEIELLKEQLDSKKETYRLTRKDVLEIVRDEIQAQSMEQKADEYKIISMKPTTDGKNTYTHFLISVWGETPVNFIRYSNSSWADGTGYLDKKEDEKLENAFRKMMGFYV